MVSKQLFEDLEQKLKDLYSDVPSPPSGLRRPRGRMLSEAAQLATRQANHTLAASRTERMTRRRKMNVMLVYKALAAVLAAAVAIAGMGGGVVLAADALPGDFLYPVKLVSEDVRLALTRDPSARAELEMAFVDLRVQEMVRLAQQGQEIRQAEVDRMTRQMEQVMVEIAKAQPEEAPALLERLIERTWLHQRVLEDRLTEMQTRLWEAIQLMERTRLNAEKDPKYLEYQHQNRYQGEQGGQGEGQQTPEQNQNSYQGERGAQGEGQQNQEQNEQQTHEQSQEQNHEQSQQQNQEQNEQQTHEQTHEQSQNSYEGEQSPTSDGEPQPTGTQQRGGNSSKGH